MIDSIEAQIIDTRSRGGFTSPAAIKAMVEKAGINVSASDSLRLAKITGTSIENYKDKVKDALDIELTKAELNLDLSKDTSALKRFISAKLKNHPGLKIRAMKAIGAVYAKNLDEASKSGVNLGINQIFHQIKDLNQWSMGAILEVSAAIKVKLKKTGKISEFDQAFVKNEKSFLEAIRVHGKKDAKYNNAVRDRNHGYLNKSGANTILAKERENGFILNLDTDAGIENNQAHMKETGYPTPEWETLEKEALQGHSEAISKFVRMYVNIDDPGILKNTETVEFVGRMADVIRAEPNPSEPRPEMILKAYTIWKQRKDPEGQIKNELVNKRINDFPTYFREHLEGVRNKSDMWTRHILSEDNYILPNTDQSNLISILESDTFGGDSEDNYSNYTMSQIQGIANGVIQRSGSMTERSISDSVARALKIKGSGFSQFAPKIRDDEGLPTNAPAMGLHVLEKNGHPSIRRNTVVIVRDALRKAIAVEGESFALTFHNGEKDTGSPIDIIQDGRVELIPVMSKTRNKRQVFKIRIWNRDYSNEMVFGKDFVFGKEIAELELKNEREIDAKYDDFNIGGRYGDTIARTIGEVARDAGIMKREYQGSWYKYIWRNPKKVKELKERNKKR